MRADYVVALLRAVGDLVPESASDLQRTLTTLQAALRQDAVLPSHTAVVTCAALQSLAQIASKFPEATIQVQEQLQAWAAHRGLPRHARSAAAAAHLELIAADNDLNALVNAVLLLLDDTPDQCALLAAACAAASGIVRRNLAAIARSRAVSASAKHPTRAKLPMVCAIHAHIDRRGQPRLRHEAFRLLRILAGAEPTLLQAVEDIELAAPDAAAAPAPDHAKRALLWVPPPGRTVHACVRVQRAFKLD